MFKGDIMLKDNLIDKERKVLRSDQLLRRAAENGYAGAKTMLSIKYNEMAMKAYVLEDYYPYNLIYAYMWMSAAEKYGDWEIYVKRVWDKLARQLAEKNLKPRPELPRMTWNSIKEKMTPSQIKEAEKLAQKCIRAQDFRGCGATLEEIPTQ